MSVEIKLVAFICISVRDKKFTEKSVIVRLKNSRVNFYMNEMESKRFFFSFPFA
jgi:hypothetical protein